MSPSETATLNHLANTMEGNKFWTLDGSGSQRTRSPSESERPVPPPSAEAILQVVLIPSLITCRWRRSH